MEESGGDFRGDLSSPKLSPMTIQGEEVGAGSTRGGGQALIP